MEMLRLFGYCKNLIINDVSKNLKYDAKFFFNIYEYDYFCENLIKPEINNSFKRKMTILESKSEY